MEFGFTILLIIFVGQIVVMPYREIITIRCRYFCAGVHNTLDKTELNLGISSSNYSCNCWRCFKLFLLGKKYSGLKLLNWKLNDKQIVNSKIYSEDE
jgi:hypothetical protein